MDKYTSDKFSLLGHSLKQCGFESLEDYDRFREELIKEADIEISKNKKNIFRKLWDFITLKNEKEIK